MSYELFFVSTTLYLWLTCGWSALSQLSGGLVRHYESKSKRLSERLENWLCHKKEYQIVFRILMPLFLAVISSEVYAFASLHFPGYSHEKRTLLTLAAIFCITIISETLGRILIFRHNILILKLTIPVVRLLRKSVFMPIVNTFMRLHAALRHNSYEHHISETRASAEDEIMSLVEDGGAGKEALEEDEKRMIRSIFDLDDTLVR